MKIDLKEYGSELGYWLEAFKPFVHRTSHAALDRLKEELENGRDNHRPSFPWKLDKQVMTTETARYDGRNRSPHKVRVGWQFEACFARFSDKPNRNLHAVVKMVTHIHVYSCYNEKEILHFHHDMKNDGQLGPHVHVQLSEAYLNERGRVAIAVPRFPSVAMLPTDCFDLVLSEFFPYDWPKAQSGIIGLTKLQAGQRKRMRAMSEALAKGWDGSRRTPIAAIQDCYMPDLQIV